MSKLNLARALRCKSMASALLMGLGLHQLLCVCNAPKCNSIAVCSSLDRQLLLPAVLCLSADAVHCCGVQILCWVQSTP